jgi:hypothetical protein
MIKKILFLSLGLMFLGMNSIDAQSFKYGLRFGGATTAIDATAQTIKGANNTDSLIVNLQSSNFGIHAGVFARVGVADFYIQPEVLFNTKSQEYTVYNLQAETENILEDKFTSLDIPIMLGYKYSSLRFQGGVIGSMVLTNSNDLIEYFATQEDLVTSLEGFNWGWQAGLGLDIGKFMIDLKYEGNFNRVANDITLYGNTYNFDARLNRFIVTFGYSF